MARVGDKIASSILCAVPERRHVEVLTFPLCSITRAEPVYVAVELCRPLTVCERQHAQYHVRVAEDGVRMRAVCVHQIEGEPALGTTTTIRHRRQTMFNNIFKQIEQHI